MAVEAPQHSGLEGVLDYLAEQPLPPGTLVRVPLGRRQVCGIVWPGEGDAAGVGLKPVEEALTALAPLSGAWCALIEFSARYYQRGIGELALAVLPPELRALDEAALARRLKRLPSLEARAADAPALPPLTHEQQAALQALEDGPARGRPALLHGVTGSGKTEVYLR
ncbi:MAG TPA: primosomal protein N', partial [Burkholderiaceae bacterium]